MLPGIKEEDEDENDHGQGGFTEAIGTPISLAKTPKVDPGKQGMANLKAALAFNKCKRKIHQSWRQKNKYVY